MLEVQGVTAGYGMVDVLFNVSLEIKEGELVTIIGPNGAGKSTLLRVIAGILPLREGRIMFKGEELDGKIPAHRLKMGIGYIPQEDKIFPGMTTLDNLHIGGYTLRKDEFQEMLERVYELFPVLKERRNQVAGTLSGGERQMLAIGRALMVRPTLMLLDEPTSGLQPSLVMEVLDRVKELNQQGMAILLVAQTQEAAQIAERGYLLRAGEILVEDSMQGLLNNPQVMGLYFGG